MPPEQERDHTVSSDKSEDSYEDGECLKVLVAEDDVAQQELIADMLDVMGHNCDIEEDGESAMEKFEPGTYDLVLTDRAMPEMRGDEVARAVRRLENDIPIIMVTGFGDMMDAAAEHPEDVDLVISKPLSLKKLGSAIENAREA
jgi:CheY-like chemotaxis protein